MPTYRKIIIILASNLFRLVLFFTISIVAAILIYTDRNYVPTVLDRNEVYSRVVNALLETNKEQSLTVGSEITLKDPQIQNIVKESFPSNELEEYSNQVIASIYDWLEQEESTISFKIDLTENKLRLANGLANFAVNRMQSLPICTETIAEVDPFSIKCQPEFIDYEAEKIKLADEIYNEPGFLKDPVITQDIIISQESSDSYKTVPIIYSLGKVLPVIVTLILVVLALIVIFSSSTKKKGYKKIGKGLVGAGASLIFFTVLFTFVLPIFTGSLPIFQSSEQGIDGLLNEVTLDLGRDYSWMIIKVSAPLILIGISLIIYARIGQNKKDYKSVKLKSGVISSNEQKKKTKAKKITKNTRPPVQSSESSDTKPKKLIKNKKYRKIPKKEL